MGKKLKISPEFKNLIPPLSDEELQQLEQNIIAEGKCRDAIKVWRGLIIDGHNRYAICQEHNIPYSVQKIRLASKTDAIVWIANNQLGRRNLTAAMKIEIACKKAEMLGATTYARKQIAKDAGVSENTVHKYMKITGEGSAELIEQVRSGEVKIGAAHKALCMSTKTVEMLCSKSDVYYVNMVAYVGRIMAMCGVLNGYTKTALNADEVYEVGVRVGVLFKVMGDLGRVR